MGSSERTPSDIRAGKPQGVLYRSWSAYLRERFGGRVHKISLDLGAGCPHRKGLARGGCVFCDAQGGGSGAFLRGVSPEEQVCAGAAAVRRRFGADKAILYFQGYSTTMLPLDELRTVVASVLAAARGEIDVVGVAVGTRPDLVPEPVLDWLESFSEEGLDTWLELGVQTTDDAGLAFLGRAHAMTATDDALSRAARRRIFLCAHLIAGIPGEAPDQLLHSARHVVDRGVLALKFHPLHVLADTALETLFRQGAFFPLPLEEYAARVAEAIRGIPPSIVIQRLSADAHAPRLVAPAWVADKTRVTREIERLLAS